MTMTLNDALECALKAYQKYYNINRTSPAEPFAAEAVFQLHDEQYFLLRSAKLSEADSREHVFFAVVPSLTGETAAKLDQSAWELGLQRVHTHANHRNTDVTLIILTEHLTEEAAAFTKKTRHYKSYRFGLHGWSGYRMFVYDVSSGRFAHNRLGENLKGIIHNMQQ